MNIKTKLIAMAALALLTLTGCVYYPGRPVAYAYPVDPNMPPPVVYVPSPDPGCYAYPYAYGAPIFSFNWGCGGGYSCNGGGNSVKNTYNYYGHPQQGGWGGGHPSQGGGQPHQGGGYHSNAKR